jgi:hypothetical protein
MENLPAARVSESVRNQKARGLGIGINERLGFSKNGVVQDETGFNLHMTRNFGRSAKETPAKAILPTAKLASPSLVPFLKQA